MARPTRQELAWAAGYLDGEGYFGLDPSGRASLEACSINPHSVYRLASLFGGTVSSRPPYGGRGRHVWRWRVFGPAARRTAKMVLPFLALKGPEAEALVGTDLHRPGTAMFNLLRSRALRHRYHEYL